MPVQLIKLRGVLEEEAQELRELLKQHRIDFYETPAGNWGISMPAIWLRDDHQLDEAKRLVDDYQRARAVRVRAEFEALKQEGKQRTVLHVVREHPLRALAYLALAAFVIYLSTMPFLELASG